MIGIFAAWGVAQLLLTVMHPFPAGPLKYLIVLALVLLISATAILVPALRAARISPMSALRQ